MEWMLLKESQHNMLVVLFLSVSPLFTEEKFIPYIITEHTPRGLQSRPSLGVKILLALNNKSRVVKTGGPV